MNNFIGLNIKYLCDKNLLSQKEFGDLFGITQAGINTYTSGRSNPSVENIQKICQHFEITIDDFINTELASKKDKKPENVSYAMEPNTAYSDKDKVIAAQQDTIDAQKELISNLRRQLSKAS